MNLELTHGEISTLQTLICEMEENDQIKFDTPDLDGLWTKLDAMRPDTLLATHNDRDISPSVNGTSCIGEISARIGDLVMVFGLPMQQTCDKTDAEWHIKIGSKVFTIYNYKDGKNYCGDDGTPTHEIDNWHIGGHEKAHFAFFMDFLDAMIEVEATG